MNFCPNCFEKINTSAVNCTKCGCNVAEPQEEGRLPYGTVLNDQFIIGKCIGQGGFGITYKAYDSFNNKIVAVKEYMPSDFAHREGLNIVANKSDTKAVKVFENGKTNYIAEIKTLYKFRDEKNIVKIIQHFTENNTVYLIMEFLDGYNLKSAMHQKGGMIDISKARDIIYDIAKILEKVHKEGVLHRDISPENIFIVKNRNMAEEVKLIDFGAAKSYLESEEAEKSIFLKPGFAPPEQYSKKGNQGPWTDVYALAATLYYIVSGKSVQESKKRMERDEVKPLCDIVPNVSVSMSRAVEKAMRLDYMTRTRDCTEFLKDLDKSGWTVIGGVESKAQIMNKNFTWPNQNNIVQKQSYREAQLICSIYAVNSPLQSKVYSFNPTNIVRIGRTRERSNFIPYPDSHISRTHCEISYDMNNNVFLVKDISANGTFRGNGQRLIKNRQEVFKPGEAFWVAQPKNTIVLSVRKK